MTRRFIALPIAFAALTALTACGQEDPFADKTSKNCLEVDSITFRADGVLTATKDGELVPEDEFLKFKKISETEAEIEIPRISEKASATLLDDGTLLVELPAADISNICTPVDA